MLRYTISNQKGALFGLDARLGLMVFAALSVIAGFYGFSRVKMAKEAALLRDLQAYEKALNEYQTDMNTFFLFTINKDDSFSEDASKDLEVLWDKSKVKSGFQHLWNGPYLHTRTLNHKTYGKFGMMYGQEVRTEECQFDTSCYVWLWLSDVPVDMWKEINKYLDERGGKYPEESPFDSGIVQAPISDSNYKVLYLRTIQRK